MRRAAVFAAIRFGHRQRAPCSGAHIIEGAAGAQHLRGRLLDHVPEQTLEQGDGVSGAGEGLDPGGADAGSEHLVDEGAAEGRLHSKW